MLDQEGRKNRVLQKMRGIRFVPLIVPQKTSTRMQSLKIQKTPSEDGSDDLADGFEAKFLSNILQEDADDKNMIDDVIDDKPQKSPIVEASEKRKSVSPPDPRQVHPDVSLQSTAA